LARPYKRQWPGERDEFESVAALALVEAANSFDRGRGVHFATFARLRIDGALRDLRRELIDHDQRFLTFVPSHGEVLAGEGCPTYRGRLIGVAVPEAVGAEFERRELVEHWLAKLPRRHAYACRQTYFHQRTQTEMARALGYSQSRVSTIHREAIELLRDMSQAEGYAA
jgi:RNA polymerase sigma factor for flagellar operon FliA